jgi:hypothetical protein
MATSYNDQWVLQRSSERKAIVRRMVLPHRSRRREARAARDPCAESQHRRHGLRAEASGP